jgi:hypothetical protein
LAGVRDAREDRGQGHPSASGSEDVRRLRHGEWLPDRRWVGTRLTDADGDEDVRGPAGRNLR